MQQQSERLETLVRIGRLLSSDVSLTRGQILSYVYQHASAVLPFEQMVIGLYDKAADTLIFEFACINGERVDLDSSPNWEPPHAGVRRTAWIVQEKRPLFLPNLRAWRKWHEMNPEHCGDPVASYIGVPMLVGDKVLGVIAITDSHREYAFDEDDLRLMQAMADYAAIALENKLVSAQLKSLVRIGREISAQIDLSEAEILNLIHEQISPLMPTDNMYIALYDGPDEVRFGLAYANGERLHDWMPGAGKSRMYWIISHNEPLIHRTRRAGEEWYEEQERENTEPVIFPSYLGVPIAVRGKVLGMIALYHPTLEYVYNDSDLEILEAVADYAAIGLNNAQLYREARGDVLASQKLATLGMAMAALQHRVHNVFTFITPALESLRRRVNLDDPTVVEILGDIEQNVSFTSRLISRVRQLSTEGEAQGVQIAAILNDVIVNVRTRYKQVEFVFEVEDRLPEFEAPIGQMTEIFTNLVENACRAMPKGGVVTLKGRYNAAERKIEVRVIDTGEGINPKFRGRLFVRPVPAGGEHGGSSGLGLWISKLILTSMGGNIQIETTGANGTTMFVTIPAG